jgi:hypothetical protein
MSLPLDYTIKNVRMSFSNMWKEPNSNNDDIRIFHRYVSNKSLYLVIVNSVETKGWDKTLEILIEVFDDTNKSIIMSKFVKMDPSQNYVADLFVEDENFNFIKSNQIFSIEFYNYNILHSPNILHINLNKFNDMFKSEINYLSKTIFVIGIDKNFVGYIAGDLRIGWSEIIKSINLFNQVLITYHSHLLPYYYAICYEDGYLKNNYMPHTILKPRNATKEHFDDEGNTNLDEYYPIYHKKKWILSQSSKKNVPFTEPIIDRHFFYYNYYKYFQGIGRGIPFEHKIPKIVYAGDVDHGNKQNFVRRKDINKNPRHYLFENVKSKNVIGELSTRIPKEKQIYYKYILDIDGIAATWDSRAWKLASGSVLFLTESSWKIWYEDLLVPYVNYIPIKEDFNDIDEKFVWCENHQKECIRIAYEGKMLFDKIFNFNYIITHLSGVINKIN